MNATQNAFLVAFAQKCVHFIIIKPVFSSNRIKFKIVNQPKIN